MFKVSRLFIFKRIAIPKLNTRQFYVSAPKNNEKLSLPGTSQSYDSQRYLTMLENENISAQQSEMILVLLAGAIDESVQSIQGGVITKEEQRINAEAYKEEFKELRKDIDSLGKKDFAVLKMELERLINDVAKFKEGMRGEINRVLAGVRLDINLEKGRVKDEVAILEGKIQSASERIDREVTLLQERLFSIEKDITSTITRIMGFLVGAFAIYKFIYMQSKFAKGPQKRHAQTST